MFDVDVSHPDKTCGRYRDRQTEEERESNMTDVRRIHYCNDGGQLQSTISRNIVWIGDVQHIRRVTGFVVWSRWMSSGRRRPAFSLIETRSIDQTASTNRRSIHRVGLRQLTIIENSCLQKRADIAVAELAASEDLSFDFQKTHRYYSGNFFHSFCHWTTFLQTKHDASFPPVSVRQNVLTAVAQPLSVSWCPDTQKFRLRCSMPTILVYLVTCIIGLQIAQLVYSGHFNVFQIRMSSSVKALRHCAVTNHQSSIVTSGCTETVWRPGYALPRPSIWLQGLGF